MGRMKEKFEEIRYNQPSSRELFTKDENEIISRLIHEANDYLNTAIKYTRKNDPEETAQGIINSIVTTQRVYRSLLVKLEKLTR
jgi:glutamate mutase epsilon subunit